MSYLNRLSQQTGLAPAAPQIHLAKSSPAGLRQVEEFVAPASLGLSRIVEQPTLPTNLSSSLAVLNPEPAPFWVLPLPPSASLDFPQPAAPVQPGSNSSQQRLSVLRPPHLDDWRVTDSGVTVPSASPETTADASQPLVRLPERTVERSQALAPETLPQGASSPSATPHLQTLQTVRDWVSASPEESRQAEAVSVAGPSQAVPMAPAQVQVINPAKLALSPPDRLSLGQVSSPWDMAANSVPFPASTTEPTTVISIGSIQVMVEGLSAPPAPAPAGRSESPRPPARLSRHYLRLR